MPIPVTDPRHPLYRDAKPLDGERGRFADRHTRNPRICPDCGLLDRHRGEATVSENPTDVCPRVAL